MISNLDGLKTEMTNNSNWKVYIDPYFAENPNAEVKVGYKGWKRTQENIDSLRNKLSDSTLDFSEEDGKWALEQIEIWDSGDHSDGLLDAGFYYCPFIPFDISFEFVV